MINRVSELFPGPLHLEFRRLARSAYPAAELIPQEGSRFECRWLVNTWLRDFTLTGSDMAGMLASVAWIKDGPKIARVTEEQYQALSQVEVRMELKDFTMPFPVMLMDMPPGHLHRAVLVYRYLENVLICNSVSYDNEDDICTVIRQTERETIDVSLGRYYDTADEEVTKRTQEALRVACNMLLTLTTFGCKTDPIFPHEVTRDEKLAREQSERGQRARDRLQELPHEVKFLRTVRLYEQQQAKSQTPGEKTGREMPFGWRRGCWCHQPCGPDGKDRRLIFRKPCMVRPDKMVGSPADYTTTYQ